MAGQIIKRGDRTWLVRVFMGRDDCGKRHYANKMVHGTKKEAERYLTAALRQRDLGTFIEPSRMTIDTYFDRWLESAVKPRVRESTYDDYSFLLARYVRPLLGKRMLSDVRLLDIQKLYREMSDHRELSARTVRMLHAVLSSAMKQAVKWQLLAANPCGLADLPRRERKEMGALNQEQAARFLAVASEDDDHGTLFAFALSTGMRPAEYLGLRWKEVDLTKGTVSVQRTVVWRKGGGWYFSEPKTRQSRRTIPLPASVVRALSEHRRKQIELRLKAGADYQNNELVWATNGGTPIMLRNLVRRHFKPTLKRAGLPSSIRLYDLRHTCATLLLAAGVNPKVVSERLGHASIVLTLDTYSHVLPTMQQAAAEKLESLLFG